MSNFHIGFILKLPPAPKVVYKSISHAFVGVHF